VERIEQLMSMLAHRNPNEAYRRVDFDARVAGSDPAHLVALCYESAASAMSRALHADVTGDNQAKSQAMTRALAAITALQMGVAGDAAVAASLRQFYGAVRKTLLDSALSFDAGAVATMRLDLIEIAAALLAAKTDS
jgi:flagellin-specific chaperone FliS